MKAAKIYGISVKKRKILLEIVQKMRYNKCKQIELVRNRQNSFELKQHDKNRTFILPKYETEGEETWKESLPLRSVTFAFWVTEVPEKQRWRNRCFF